MADLSPATSAIVAAFDARYELCGPFDDNWQELCLAAVLRVLADHQPAPITLGQPIDHWSPDERTRQELRNIAAELEATIPDLCADCGGPIDQDAGPPDGWQLEDGRTVCDSCCVVNVRLIVDAATSHHQQG